MLCFPDQALLKYRFMTDDRELVYRKISDALAPLKQAGKRTPYPDWDKEMAICRAHPEYSTLWDLFSAKLQAVNGTPLQGLEALGKWLHEAKQTLGYCDPAVLDQLKSLPTFAGIKFETTFDRARVDDYAFGITQAAGAIAESGTVMLKDALTSSRLAALAPWTHIALLKPSTLYPDIPTALTHLGDDPAVVWATGPSKTADIEGILIEGVHGPGTQVCCLLDA